MVGVAGVVVVDVDVLHHWLVVGVAGDDVLQGLHYFGGAEQWLVEHIVAGVEVLQYVGQWLMFLALMFFIKLSTNILLKNPDVSW